MNVHQAVTEYIKSHGWPVDKVRIGPYSCGVRRTGRRGKCRTVHAYAETRLSVNHSKTHEMWMWDYLRPCDGNMEEYKYVKPSRG